MTTVRTEVQYEHHHLTLIITESPTVLADGIEVQPVRLRLDVDTDGSSHIVLDARWPNGLLYAYSAEALGGWPRWVLALAEEHRPAQRAEHRDQVLTEGAGLLMAEALTGFHLRHGSATDYANHFSGVLLNARAAAQPTGDTR